MISNDETVQWGVRDLSGIEPDTPAEIWALLLDLPDARQKAFEKSLDVIEAMIKADDEQVQSGTVQAEFRYTGRAEAIPLSSPWAGDSPEDEQA